MAMGLLSPRLLPFFWRATALAPADHDAAKRMLLDAMLIEVAAGEEMRLMMPMHVGAEASGGSGLVGRETAREPKR